MELGGWQGFAWFGPELALGGTALVVRLLAFARRLRKRGLGELALLGASLSVFLAARLSGWGEVWIFGRLAIVDGFAVTLKVLVGLATVAVLWLSLESGEIREREEGRVSSLVLAAALGLYLMASAANLLIAYLSIELASLASRAAMGGPGREPKDPSFVDLLSGAAASVAMIAGFSWIAGFAGFDYAAINDAIVRFAPASPPALPLAGALIVAGFSCKVATIAFRDPRPDTSRGGAATPLVAFVAVAFTAGSFALWIRFLDPTISRPGAGGSWIVPEGAAWQPLLLGASMVMMLVGSMAALACRDVRHLLAWSSLAHVGTALVGAASLDDNGLRWLLFYVAASSIANLGAFSVAASVTRATGRYDLAAYRGLVYRRGFVPAAAMTIFLLSLAGLPPGVGFVAKLRLGSIARDHEPLLFAVLVGASAVLLGGYARVIRRMLVRTGDESAPPVRMNPYDGFLIALLVALVVAFGVYPTPLTDLVRRSIHFVQW
ncbi:MAG: NADH-quinone oxidoreductase subunit N [Candidatus Binatia bacterium]